MMKPHVIIFNSISLDGRIDFGSGRVDMGTYYSLAAKWNADAMLSGSNTMLKASPLEEMFDPDSFEKPAEYHPLAVPLLVVVDSKGRVRNWNYIRRQPFFHEVAVLCSKATPKDYLDYLTKLKIDYIVTGKNHVDLKEGLEAINERFRVKSVRVDSGGILNGVLLRAGLVDEFSVLLDPCLVGGTSPASIFNAWDLNSTEGIIQLRLIHLEQLKDDIIWLKYEIIK
jgi:2,5-diamino-6-(ribosylamino)-4(3H)-pyrimidinone 5'-phosphate reductase